MRNPNIYIMKWINLFEKWVNTANIAINEGFKEGRKPTNYWTYEKCKEEALKYETKKELGYHNITVYHIILRNKWLELLSHMENLKNPISDWTYEKCKEEALKYNMRSDFASKSSSAYVASKRNGWLDDVCSHMSTYVREIKPSKWTYERCKEVALKCDSKSELSVKYSAAYKMSLKNGWLDDICSHMKRNREEKETSVKKEIVDKGINPDKEKELKIKVDKYEKDMLDKLFAQCEQEAKKYKTVADFKYNSFKFYLISKNNKWLNIFFTTDINQLKKDCKKEAKKYKNSVDFKYYCYPYFKLAQKNNWLHLFF